MRGVDVAVSPIARGLVLDLARAAGEGECGGSAVVGAGDAGELLLQIDKEVIGAVARLGSGRHCGLIGAVAHAGGEGEEGRV